MPYELTYWSPPYLKLTGKSKAVFQTAAEAWKEYEGMVRSDEKVEIRISGGREIGSGELEMLAQREGT